MNTSKYLSLTLAVGALFLASSAIANESETMKYMDNPSAPSSVSRSETTVEQAPGVLMEGQSGNTTVIEQPGSTKTTTIEKQMVPEPTAESKATTVKRRKTLITFSILVYLLLKQMSFNFSYAFDK